MFIHDRIGIKAIIIVSLLIWVTVGLGNWVSWGPQPEKGTKAEVVSSDKSHTLFQVELPGLEYNTVTVNGKECAVWSIPEAPKIMEVGKPELPMIRQALVIPDKGNVVVEVKAIHFREIPCEMVVPSKGHLNRNIDPATVPYVFDDTYQRDAWFPEETVANDEPFIIRDFRGTVIQINAVRWNPVRKMLKVVEWVELEVRTTGDDGINAINRTEPVTQLDKDFLEIYSRLFLNFDETDYTPITEPGRMFIITNPNYYDAIQAFYHWKQQKGVPVEVYTTTQTGSSSTQIKTFIQNAYNTPQRITYIVLVGDIADIPTIAGVYEGADSDPCYVKLAGSDNYPDAFISRISATSPSAVEYQAYRFIRYESSPDVGAAGEWYHKGVGIGGDDMGSTSLMDWERCELLRTVLMNYHYTQVDQIYHSSATAAQVTTALNNGRGIINYIGHGSTTAWTTTGFSNTNVYALSNGWMQPFIVDVACVNGDFSYPECFAEAWLRAGSLAQPKGAIGMYAASTNASWVPPCDMQTGCIDLICHEERNTLGGICFNGVMYAMDIWGASNNSEGNKLLEQTNLFGDCNLMLRTDTPTAMTVNHNPVLFLGNNTYDVQVPGVTNALVCLYANGVQYGMSYTNAQGNAQIVMASPPTNPMTLTLTVTAYNRVPYIANINVLPMSGPYLVCDSLVISDIGNPNGMVEFGETVRLSVWLENVGIIDAVNTIATLQSSDQYITITDASETYGTIISGGRVGRTNAFEFQVHGDIPDGHSIALTISVSADSGRYLWEIPQYITAHSAEFRISDFVIDDYSGNSNGILEAGETADITLTVANDGSAATTNLVNTLTTDSPYLQIMTGSSTHIGIAAGGTGTFTPDFRVHVQTGCPNFTPAVLYFGIGGSRSLVSHLLKSVTLGGFREIVETGQGSWSHTIGTTGWNDQWHISTLNSHSPTHSWKCGDTSTGLYLSHMDAVLVTPTLTLPNNCQLTFWHRMDAEASGSYPDSAYDGGIIEISVGGGAWTQITPQNGYTHHIRRTAGGGNPYTGPFTPGIPAFSGQIAWRMETCSLSGYSGSIQIRFRFGTDNATAREGWFVDDIQIDAGSAMTPPTNLEASLAGSIVTLNWSSPGVTPQMALLSYNIYRNSVKVDSLVQNLEYTDNLAQLGHGTYSYQVSANYDNGESALTPPVSVDYTGGLNTVENLVIRCSRSNATLTWSPVANATGYRIYRSNVPENPMSTGSLIGTAAGTTFTDSNAVQNRVQAFYAVTAVDE